MPYIPAGHQRYGLLPLCCSKGGEVFEYPTQLIMELEEFLNTDETIIPFGYNSYEEYYAYLDEINKENADNKFIKNKIEELKREIRALNIKENWAVVQYVGKTTDSLFGLTNGRFYYCTSYYSRRNTIKVIDDEEFTSYEYGYNPNNWIIFEDPKGILGPFDD